MEKLEHSTTLAWFEQLADRTSDPRTLVGVYRHLVLCAQCRGALLLLAITHPSLIPGPVNQQCANDIAAIAAFVDNEADLGLRKAAFMDPQTWWHLTTCMDCASMYDMTATLRRAADQHHLPTWPPRRRIQTLSLRRFAIATAASHLRPQVRSGQGHRTSIVKQAVEGEQRVLISVGKSQEGWFVQVTRQPPTPGFVDLDIEGQTFSAHFNAQGEAILANLPQGVFDQAQGEDLICSISED